jgi:2-oxoisovalerate dehydrogenase E2 component (dihydrolipoyl transacylase)
MSEYVFKLPDLGEGTVESEIGEWNVKVGDHVEEEAVIGTMMTDKAAIEVQSPVSGRVVSLAGEPGDIVAVGAPLVIFETDKAPAKAPATETEPVEPAAEAAVVAAEPVEPAAEAAVVAAETQEPEAPPRNNNGGNGKVVTSPAIRRRAKEAGIDLAEVPGSGTGGRILRSDFDAYLKSLRMEHRALAAPAVMPTPSRTEEIKVIGLRRKIAERMTEANREVPHFSYVEEMDVTELEALRQHLNGRADAAERLTLLPFISMALMRALRDFPQCNTTYDKNRNVLLRHGAVHLGVATQTPDGLKVPVVRNAQALRLEELAAEVRRVSEAARNNTASRGELTGSTITVTSLGKLGGIVSTPVINLPEVAIIGVNRAVQRPVVIDGQVTVRLMMNLSSSFDHRFVDGYDAAAMIQKMKDLLEHPATIFI